MNEFIRRRIAAQPHGWLGQLAVAAACVALATLARYGIAIWMPRGIAFVTFYPVLLVAGVVGGFRASLLCLLGGMLAGSTFLVEARTQWPPVSTGWTAMVAFLISGGLIIWATELMTRALKALDAVQGDQQVLVMELQHRVKNTLAIVQALAAQTFREPDTDPALRATFTERLIALGGAHNLLSDSGWREVTLSGLVAKAIQPFQPAEADRIRVRGEDLMLRAELIVDLALCLHELCANATKHGALSNAAGQVDIHWRRIDDGQVELSWTEAGGPPVKPPTRHGFGSRLLEQGLSRRARAVASTEFRPEGVRWTTRFAAE